MSAADENAGSMKMNRFCQATTKRNISKNKCSICLASAFSMLYQGCSWQPGLEVHEECGTSGVGNIKDNKMKMKLFC